VCCAFAGRYIEAANKQPIHFLFFIYAIVKVKFYFTSFCVYGIHDYHRYRLPVVPSIPMYRELTCTFGTIVVNNKNCFIQHCPFSILQYKCATQRKLNICSTVWSKKKILFSFNGGAHYFFFPHTAVP
jgi:hypothetical protein